MGGYIGARAGSLSTTTVANVQDVTATDTTPEVTIINSTHEDTDGGREGKVIFKGQQSGGEESTLAEIQASHDGTADDEKGDLIFKTNDGSDGASPTERLRIDSSGFLGINESAPSGTLHVKGTSSSHGKIILEAGGSAGTANNRFVEFNLEDGTKIAEIQVPQTITNGGGDIIFKTKHTSGTPADRMRVLASGALTVGSGTENAGYSPLQIGSTSTSSTIMQLLSSTAGAGTIHFGDAASGTGRYVGYLTYDHSGNNMAFGTSGSERMRIASDGDVMINTTSDIPWVNNAGSSADNAIVLRNDGLFAASRYAGNAAYFNRTSNDGAIIVFNKDGSNVGQISTVSGDIAIFSMANNHTGWRFGSNQILPTNNTGTIIDNTVDLGDVSFRLDDIYATNGTIQTSDENEKQDIASLTSAEITAATAISKLFKTFKWKDKVGAKGDNARTHTGVIAQQVQSAMSDAGLDASKYAFWCSDTWWAKDVEVAAVEADEEKGIEAQDAYTRTDIYNSKDEAPEGAIERTRLGVRYPELLAFVGAATEQRLTSIESRLTALEAE